MFLLVRADGSVQGLPGIAAIRNEGNELLCFDNAGAVAERYSAQEVLLYGDEARITPLIAETRAGPVAVQKMQVDGSEEPCCATGCIATATVIFTFDSAQGCMTLGLCRAHQDLIDDDAKKIVLNRLDLRRVTIAAAEPPLGPD